MPGVLVDKPYEPVPPHPGRFWPWLLSLTLPRQLRRSYGVTQVTFVHDDRLAASLKAGHGILLAPNHCRDEDPLIIGLLSRKVGSPFYAIASWHLFAYSKFRRFLLSRAGAFSINREGMDKAALNHCVDILATADRPLVLFPEGHITRTNDVLAPLMDGLSLITRQAAKKRAKEGGKTVVIHPVAIRYHFKGDVTRAATSVLDEIERRLTWAPLTHLPLHDRILKVGAGLLALKELEYLGHTQPGTIAERLARLSDSILSPIEAEWCRGADGAARCDGSVIARVKRIRSAIMPDLIKGELPEQEESRRWRQLNDATLAQQLSHYPPDYAVPGCPPERILETVERFEQDLTEKIRLHGEIHATVTIGDAIPVNPGREPRDSGDPIMTALETQLRALLGLPPEE